MARQNIIDDCNEDENVEHMLFSGVSCNLSMDIGRFDTKPETDMATTMLTLEHTHTLQPDFWIYNCDDSGCL